MDSATEYLRSVNWRALLDGQGNAVHLPENLIALTSTDVTMRDMAYESLVNRLAHAGSRYEASPYAVPYLLELVRQRATPNKGRVFYLLSLVAVGEDYEYLSGSFDPQELRNRVEMSVGLMCDGGKEVNDHHSVDYNNADLIQRALNWRPMMQ